MLIIECPFCGKKEEREFRDGRNVHHSIVCDECKLIERGRMTLVDMLTSIAVLLGSNRPKLDGTYVIPLHLISLRASLNDAIKEIDLYIDEVPF